MKNNQFLKLIGTNTMNNQYTCQSNTVLQLNFQVIIQLKLDMLKSWLQKKSHQRKDKI